MKHLQKIDTNIISLHTMMKKFALHLFLFSLSFWLHSTNAQTNTTTNSSTFHVGVILDLNSTMGKVVNKSIWMALSDYYAVHGNESSSRVELHVRDSKGDVINAASAALDLIQTKGVQAIIGPVTSEETDFIASMGNKAHVPIISISPISFSVSPSRFPYHVQLAQDESSQVNAIVAVIQNYRWREVSIIHDDSQSGTAILPSLTSALLEIGIVISFETVLPYNANDATVNETVYKLNDTKMRVFIVHLSLPLGSRFFLNVKQAGLMQGGYAWITTYSLTDQLSYVDSSVFRSMEGVIGLKTYVPPSNAVKKFKVQWRRQAKKAGLQRQMLEPNAYALWAYDSIFLVAIVANRTQYHLERNLQSSPSNSEMARNTTSLFETDASPVGSKLLQSVLATRLTGLSGKIQLVNGKRQSSSFEIINLRKRSYRIGYWTPTGGLSQSVSSKLTLMKQPGSEKNLSDVIWSGGSLDIPFTRILRVGIPVKAGFREFVNVTHVNNSVVVSGFSKAVFEEVMKKFRYQYDYEPYENASATYSDLTNLLFQKKYDVLVGDFTIRANRDEIVSFTPTYSVPGVRMIVRAKKDQITQSLWWFLEPLEKKLWFTTLGFFLWKGIFVWIFEHGINTEFQGTFSQQMGKILSFSFSTFVFANRERLESNYSRFIINMWMFAVFVLVTSYGANLTSMLAFENLKPTISDLRYLQMNGHVVGYQHGSFVADFLKDNWEFSEKQLKSLSTAEDYAKALSLGTHNGGVSAIVDEIPFINIFLTKYCREFTVAGQVHPSGGLGFVFPKYSLLLPDVSKEVLDLTEGEQINKIQQHFFVSEMCQDPLEKDVTSNKLQLFSFRIIYGMLAVTSVLALLPFVATSIYKSFKYGTILNASKSFMKNISFKKLVSVSHKYLKFNQKVSAASKDIELPVRAEDEDVVVDEERPRESTRRLNRLLTM